MFCRNNKKDKNIKFEKPIVHNNKLKTDYVEIRDLSEQFAQLSRFAHNINDIGKEELNCNVAMFFYQKSIKQAFVDEFERRFEELLGKKISFSDYWKSRSC